MNRREDTGADQHAHTRPGEDACCHGHGRAPAAHGCCGGGGGGACAEPEQAYVFTRRQIRELDRLAAEEFAMPSILLMENAARGVAGVILEGLQGIEDPAALVVCGPGNNGGDGLAIARHLANRDVRVAIVLGAPAAKYVGDALANLRIVQKMDLPIVEAGAAPDDAIAAALERMGDPVVVVDALLGTGLDRPAIGVAADLIGRMNALKTRGCTLVAVDVPSGLDCDTGLPATGPEGAGRAVEADLTIALAGVKAGFLAMNAQKYVGELVVVDIGAPRELVRRLGRPLAAPHLG